MKPLKIKKYKGVTNAWINPDGELYECGYMCHNEWAFEYIQDVLCGGDFSKAMIKIDEIHNNSLSAYPYTALHKLGWIRLLTWNSGKTKLLGECVIEPNELQKDTIMFWCSLNKIDYDEFIKSYNE